MATKQHLLGLVDLGREIGRPPLVGMKFLHQRAVSPPDVLGARPRRHAKDLIGLLLGHFAAARRPQAPLSHRPARAHASWAPGGQDKLPVARGCRRRTRSADRAASSDRAHRAPRPRGGRRGCVPRIAPLSWSSSISTNGARTRDTWPGGLLRALKQSAGGERSPAEQAQAGEPERDRNLQMAAREQERGHRQRQDAARRPHDARQISWDRPWNRR